MALLHVNLDENGVLLAAPWDRNSFIDSDVNGLEASVLDSSGAASGITLTYLGAGSVTDARTGAALTSNLTGYDEEVVRSAHYIGGSGGSYRFSGLTAGQGFNLTTTAWFGNDSRDTTFVVNGSALQTYDNQTGTANAPLTFSGTANASGEVIIDVGVVSTFAYVNLFILETLAAPDSVTPTETSYAYGETITLSTSLAGSITANLTDSASNVLTLTKLSDTQFTIPALVAGQSTVLAETGVQLQVDNGTDTAIAGIEITPPTGYVTTTLTSIVDRALIETDWIFGFDTPAVIGDQGFENSAIVTHNADGTSTFTGDGEYTYFTIQASSGLVSEITKTVGSGTGGIPLEFRESFRLINKYLLTQGSTSSAMDNINAWLSSEGFSGHINDKMYNYLGSLGYTGSLMDRLRAWELS